MNSREVNARKVKLDHFQGIFELDKKELLDFMTNGAEMCSSVRFALANAWLIEEDGICLGLQSRPV